VSHPSVRRLARLSAHRQRGVAALEFALVAMVLFLFLYIIATFGAVFYTQQALSRSAADGALAISASSQTYTPSAIQQVVWRSLARSLVTPVGTGTTEAAKMTWVSANVTVTVPPPPGSGNVVLTVSYPYGSNALLPSLPGLTVPQTLIGQATVATGAGS
jgi:Flp pilus assembly protein TadG